MTTIPPKYCKTILLTTICVLTRFCLLILISQRESSFLFKVHVLSVWMMVGELNIHALSSISRKPWLDLFFRSLGIKEPLHSSPSPHINKQVNWACLDSSVGMLKQELYCWSTCSLGMRGTRTLEVSDLVNQGAFYVPYSRPQSLSLTHRYMFRNLPWRHDWLSIQERPLFSLSILS
jgi:hypothetical protein